MAAFAAALVAGPKERQTRVVKPRTPEHLVGKLAHVTEIAVIIPAFNSARHLDLALASVAGQTVPPSVVVVADDCSGDDTMERARRWEAQLPLEVIRLDRNRGAGMARHCAIQATSAPLLALLDADDFILPDHLETMAATYAGWPGLISARELSWYPGQGLSAEGGPKGAYRASRQLAPLLRRNFVNFGFFSRDLYESVGGFQERRAEDWDLWIRMVRAGAALSMASHATAVHRIRPDSMSSDVSGRISGGIRVLTEALQAARSPGEAAAARAGLRALRGKLGFHRAMELVAEGQLRPARLAALRALPANGPRATAGLLALAVAPGTAARLENLTRRYRIPLQGETSADQAQAPGRR